MTQDDIGTAAGRVLAAVRRSGSGLTLEMLTKRLSLDIAQVEDALAFLVKSGFLARSFELRNSLSTNAPGKWSIKSHTRNRAQAARATPVQSSLFGDEYVETKSVVLRLRGRSPQMAISESMHSYDTAGWTVKRWRYQRVGGVDVDAIVVDLARRHEEEEHAQSDSAI